MSQTIRTCSQLAADTIISTQISAIILMAKDGARISTVTGIVCGLTNRGTVISGTPDSCCSFLHMNNIRQLLRVCHAVVKVNLMTSLL